MPPFTSVQLPRSDVEDAQTSPMLISDFDFELPAELIAQQPLATRDASKMLVLNRVSGTWRDTVFSSLPEHLNDGDTLVINNTRVFPARLNGVKETTGANIEMFLIERTREHAAGENVWRVLARPARRLPEGARVSFGDGRMRAEVIKAFAEGERLVRFETNEAFADVIEEIGQTPLPPYIKRATEHATEDRARYQTIYARDAPDGGAIAAPTAGLHFTAQVLETLKKRGVRIVEITLHVGYGTFAPVRVEDLREHKVAAERFTIDETAANIINQTRAQGRRVVAVGTTTARALESAANPNGNLIPTLKGIADLTITPGYKFKIIDALVTNFHLPRSSLLVLVASFAGRDAILAAYRHAVAAHYRFYSYGDCMLII